MRLTVLGCGTCVPSGTRVSSGYWLEAGAARLRLDCGPGTVHAMARHGVAWEGLTHQFVSHFHLDHAGDLGALLYALKHGRAAPRAAPLALVGPIGLRALVDGLAGVFGSNLLAQAFPVTFDELAPGETLDLGGAALRVAKTPHTVESLAVRIDAGGRAFGYTGDTAPSGELAAFFAGVDLLVAECSFVDDDRKTPHLVIDQCAALARAAGARRLLAVHCYFDPDAEHLAERLARGYDGEILVAEDGMVLEI